MVRTTRGAPPTAANVDDLDNLDLDDMFAEGNDDLFLDDDLGIDLGNMDDITSNAPSLTASEEPSAAAAPAHAPPVKEPSPRRRKTKRKTKSPYAYDDLDDEPAPEPKKKRRATKATSRKGKKAAASDNTATTTATKTTTKTKLKGRASMTLPLSRGTSTSGSSVAAAGQFGRRATVPKSRASKLKSRASSTAAAAAAAAAEVAAAEQQQQAAALSPQAHMLKKLTQILSTHAGWTQSSFCGLLPSSSEFYPFLPALPTELTMKNRKIYALVERIHSSLVSLQGGPMPAGVPLAKETDAIFKLVQEAYREPTTTTPNAPPPMERTKSIGSAIGRLRHTVTTFDPARLAADMYALCALLHRQHDFLKQNMDNMQKWCQQNLTAEAYVEAYLPPPSNKKRKAAQQLSVLGSFSTDQLRIRIVLPGFKEPKSALIATLPPLFTPPSDIATTNKTSGSKAKKRKTGDGGGAGTTSSSNKASSSSAVKEKVVLTYADCKPVKRRKMIADLISRIGRDLDARYQQEQEEQQHWLLRQDLELRKVVQDDKVPVIHTMGMWRWLEKSSLFSSFTEKEVRDRLQIVRQWPRRELLVVEEDDEKAAVIPKPGALPMDTMTTTTTEKEPLADRLMSLLVEEDDSDDENETCPGDIPVDALCFENEEFGGDNDDESLVDLSSLSLDEKAALHLRSLGLLKDWKSVPYPSVETIVSDGIIAPVSVPISSPPEPPSDVEQLLETMNRDLIQLDALNHRRASFLESLALSSDYLANSFKQRREQEVAINAKCQNLLKKNRDLKAKSGKSRVAKDNLALPW